MICRFAQKATLSILSACLLAGPVTGIAVAQSADAAQQNASSVSAPIRGLYDALKTAQDSGKTAQQRAAIIAPAVDRAFDLEAILRRSVGIRYNSLSAADRTHLLGSFRQFTVARYASSFKPGTNAVFTILPQVRSNPTGGEIVDTTIGGQGGDATPLNYIMVNGPSGWRITDVLLNAHISQVAAQRADFGGALSQGGANGLAELLDRKTAHFLHD
ncbi:hypothetical protein GMO_01050 [Gluconobacter morbifer G707]|uniref:Toluene transporter n=2 Tax=Gluconobacter TaxID=441 RepID=G6XF40_9PROT|nr:hypothetical protein GMO_01050 [Gluconobacter morbifer G707]